MAAKRLGRLQKVTAIVPLVLLSAAGTASLVGVNPAGSTFTAASESGDPARPSDPTVPTTAIEIPASVSSADEASSSFLGSERDVQQIVSNSTTNGIPSSALAAYQRAEAVINRADAACKLPWQLVAAIGRVESDHGRFNGNALNSDGVATPGIYGPALTGANGTSRIADTDNGELDKDTKFDHAVGPMQFIPSTWSVVQVDADNDGLRNPQDIDDAALATAVYLCSGTGDLSTLSGQKAAVYRYNHSSSYVDLVLSIMDNYLNGDYMSVPDSTRAAGYLTPVPGLTPGTKPNKGPGKAKPTETATPGPDPVQPTQQPPTTPETEDPATPNNPTGPTKPPVKLPPVKLPPIKVPPIKVPPTGVDPVDDVLTRAEALLQCTLDGVINNPLTATNELQNCIDKYMKPKKP